MFTSQEFEQNTRFILEKLKPMKKTVIAIGETLKQQNLANHIKGQQFLL